MHNRYNMKDSDAPEVGKACLQEGTNHINYWIPEMTRKGTKLLEIQIA